MVYKIYEDFYSDVEKKINRVIKKCKKYGNEFTFEKIGETIETVKRDNKTYSYKFIMVDVAGVAHINDWEFVATLEVHETGNVIRQFNGSKVEVPTMYRTTENICDHCGTKQARRKNLYLIRNTITGEFKQVGGSCLKLYTGGLNVEYITAWIDGMTYLEEQDGFVGGCTGIPCDTVKEVVAYSTVVTRKMGYSNASSDFPTRDIVRILLSSHLELAIKNLNNLLEKVNIPVEFNYKDFDNEEVKKYADDVIEYYKSLDTDSDFISNVQVIINDGYVSNKNVGYIAYLPTGYSKHLEDKRKKELESSKGSSKFFGEVGKRYKSVDVVSCNLVTSYTTMYGITYIYKFLTSDNNVLVWKTSTSLDTDKGYKQMTFTVKAHSEFRDEKQTEVTRAKLA